MNKKVEIYIACHKPSYLPDNDLFVPIHVGAEKSKIRMPIQRDDEGDNISAKNPHYCEMTAQYWAYRHSDADYIGLCHYRRFLSFCDQKFTTLSDDNREHVVIPKLTAATADKYGLTNRSRMLEKIEGCDIAVPCPMDLSMVSTPKWRKKSVLDHWLAHDRIFFREADLKRLYALVKKYYPNIYPDMVEYMNGKYFYGYNTFVMRKDLFREMSSFEFDILRRLEEKTDLSGYSPMENRIYGFMGEILYSSFIYHLKKRRPGLKILECQMLYFEDTEPEQVIQPAFPEDCRPVQVALDLEDMPGFMAEPALQSLLINRNPDRLYDIVLLIRDKMSYYKAYYQGMKTDDKVSIRVFSPDMVIDELGALYGKAELDDAEYGRGGKKTGYRTQVFLPWLLRAWKKCLYLRWNVLVNHPVDEIYDTDIHDAGLAGAVDVAYMGRLNAWKDEERNYARDVLKADCQSDMLQSEALVMNLEMLRRQKRSDIASFMKEACGKKGYYTEGSCGRKHRVPTAAEVYTTAFPVPYKLLSQEKVRCLSTNIDMVLDVGEAPIGLNAQYKAVKESDVEVFPEGSWWRLLEDPGFFVKYWNIIDASPLKELFHERRERNRIKEALDLRRLPETVKNASTNVLPYGSFRREALKAVYRGIRGLM